MGDDIVKKYDKIMKIGFAGLEAIDQEIIDTYGKIFEKGEFLIREGEETKDVFLILEGKVNITKEINTINKILAVLGPGEIVGEMSFFESVARSASCIADEKVIAIVFSDETFGEIYKVHPRWLVQILESLSKRIIKTLQVIKDRLS